MFSLYCHQLFSYLLYNIHVLHIQTSFAFTPHSQYFFASYVLSTIPPWRSTYFFWSTNIVYLPVPTCFKYPNSENTNKTISKITFRTSNQVIPGIQLLSIRNMETNLSNTTGKNSASLCLYSSNYLLKLGDQKNIVIKAKHNAEVM